MVRGGLGMLGLEVFRTRGGLFIYPRPRTRASRAATEWPEPIRLNLGCGPVRMKDFVNIDIVETAATDLTANIGSLPMFRDGSVDEILLDAVYEHLFRHERAPALREWHRVLKRGGLLRVSWIPDFDVIVDHYVHHKPAFGHTFGLEDAYMATHGNPTAMNAPEQIHKDIFTQASVRAEFERAGFDIESIESVCAPGEDVPWNIHVAARSR